MGSNKETKVYRIGKLIAAKRNRSTVSLKKRLLSAYNLEKRDPIKWGMTHESVALTKYCKEGDVPVLPTGIWLHETGILGASPNGFVQGTFKEIKCPFIAKDMTVAAACTTIKDFYIVTDEDGRL